MSCLAPRILPLIPLVSLSLEEVSERFDGQSFDITDQGAVNEISSELKAEESKVEDVERK